MERNRATSATRQLDRVREYYERNTERFERYGQPGSAIHRAVWGSGVETRDAAIHFVDELILAEIRGAGTVPRVLDLGCGVGASLLYMSTRMEIAGEGITISPLQAARAQELIRACGARNLRCREGNFLALPADIENVDLAFSIEAFVHSPDVEGFFSEAARVLRPGGKLVVCDDFLTPQGSSHPSERERRWLTDFRSGWRIGSLVTVSDAIRSAEGVGLRGVREQDLTSYLELGRPRDRWISLFVEVGRRLNFRGTYWGALSGGSALQRAIRFGAIGYSFLVFERREP